MTLVYVHKDSLVPILDMFCNENGALNVIIFSGGNMGEISNVLE